MGEDLADDLQRRLFSKDFEFTFMMNVNTDEEVGMVATGTTIPDGLGDQFGPLLREVCDQRLSSISWFRADWQRGGAKTGHAHWQLAPGERRHPLVDVGITPSSGAGNEVREADLKVVVKIPIRPTEYLWNARMQPDEEDPHGITARIFASGTTLGGYDFAWIVMEQFAAGPLFGLKRKDALELTADAVARFYRRAGRFEVDSRKRVEDWPALLERAREACRNESLPHSQSWHEAVKSVQKRCTSAIREWQARPITGWIHGDLHPANVMSRSEDDSKDPAMLIDLAEVRPGHWIEDAVYLERIYWARPSIIEGQDPVKLIRKARKRYGLIGKAAGRGASANEGDVQRLAQIRRMLLAATAPAYLRSEGNPAYLEVCLDILLQSIKKF